jgi:phosphatidylserine/phosphatidylglycerophosphate/cardiolipin synthase-like enzyme
MAAMRILANNLEHMKVVFLLMILALIPGVVSAKSYKHRIADGAAALVNEALVKVPQADEVCFAPDEPCDVKLVKFIQSAKVSLDVAIFDINLDKLVHELIIQSKKIPVRVLVDRREAKGRNSLVQLLLDAGVKVRYGHQRGIMHNKITIVDGKMIETGSFNYTNGAAFKNNENQLYSATPSIVERYKSRFEKIWSIGFASR